MRKVGRERSRLFRVYPSRMLGAELRMSGVDTASALPLIAKPGLKLESGRRRPASGRPERSVGERRRWRQDGFGRGWSVAER